MAGEGKQPAAFGTTSKSGRWQAKPASPRTSAGTLSATPSGTLLKANGEDVKTVQELLRHANSRITLDVYTQAVNSHKRAWL